MRRKIYIEPAESERKHRKFTSLAQELGIPAPQATLEMQVTMPDGAVVHHHKQRSHSWTRNAYTLMFCQLCAVNIVDNTYVSGKVCVKNTVGTANSYANPFTTGYVTGTSYIFSQASEGGGYRCPAGSAAYGIVVGTDDTAESFQDYVLIAPIANGNGAGQMAFSAQELYVVTWTPGTLTMSTDHVRYINNNSGGLITVKEVALYQRCNVSSSPYYYCQSRDVLGAPVDVPDMGQLKVTYVISLVYPE